MQRLREPDGPGKPAPGNLQRKSVNTPIVVTAARVLYLNEEGRVCHDVTHKLDAARTLLPGDRLDITVSFMLEENYEFPETTA